MDGVVVYPTDTIYGIGCLATDKNAIKKIFKIKQRGKQKGMIILVDSIKMAKKYCEISKEQEKILEEVWLLTKPRPSPLLSKERGKLPLPFLTKGEAVTLILKSRGILPKELSGGKKTLAVRLPKNDFLIKLIKKAGAPIVSTSLNLSGEKPLKNVKDLEKTLHVNLYFGSIRNKKIGNFKKKIDLVIDAGTVKGRPSRVADIRDVEKIKIIR